MRFPMAPPMIKVMPMISFIRCARQSQIIRTPTIPIARPDRTMGPQRPRSSRRPKLTPRLKTRTRSKKGRRGIRCGGSMMIVSTAHFIVRSTTDKKAAPAKEKTNTGNCNGYLRFLSFASSLFQDVGLILCCIFRSFDFQILQQSFSGPPEPCKLVICQYLS